MILPAQILLQKLAWEAADQKHISVWVLRLDLIDRVAGGNKLFKLIYNLEEAHRQGHSKILTFGGAWSNHLAAVAAARGDRQGTSYGGEVVAVVRGEEPAELSDTLRFCVEKGVQLHFVSREEYRKKTEPGFIEELKKKFGDFYLLPEGGSNELAVKGCREILHYVKEEFNYICCPVGSGGTIAGIANGLKEGQKALGFVALKGGEYLQPEIEKLAGAENFELIHKYHFGGFAKVTPELLNFKKTVELANGFELDYVYTAKMFYGLQDLISKDFFKPGEKIVALHTGGLQGNKGFEK